MPISCKPILVNNTSCNCVTAVTSAGLYGVASPLYPTTASLNALHTVQYDDRIAMYKRTTTGWAEVQNYPYSGGTTDTDTRIEFNQVLPSGEWEWNIRDVVANTILSTFTTPAIVANTVSSPNGTVDVNLNANDYELEVTHTTNPDGSITLNDGTVIPAQTIIGAAWDASAPQPSDGDILGTDAGYLLLPIPLDRFHTNETQAVPYTGIELPATVGVNIGDTKTVQFSDGAIVDYTWNGTAWIKDIEDQWFEQRICLNIATPTFTPADLLMPTVAEVQAWTLANLTDKQRLNGTHVVYFIAGQGGDCDNPDYTWVLNKGSELVTRTQNSILTLPNYTALRNLTKYNHDIVIVDDWTYIGPDGNTYTTVGGVFKRTHDRNITENGATNIIGLDGSKWEREWDKIHIQPEWWECGGYDRLGNIYSNKNVSGSYLIGYIDGIYSESDRLDNAARLVIETPIIGGKVILQKRTYLVDRPVAFVSTDGHNAIIKTTRPLPVTNTVAYTAGQTTITVSDASQYRVGMDVILTDNTMPYGGFGYAENIAGFAGSVFLITGIAGNVITISMPGAVSVAAGNSFASISKLGTVYFNSRINHINFDGDYNNRIITYDWRLTEFLSNSSTSLTKAGEFANYFEGCRADNIVGTFFSGCSFEILNCYADNIGGGIFHYGGGIIDNNAIYQWARVDGLQANNIVNIDPAISYHQEGIFTFSTNTKNIQLSNIQVKDLQGYIFSATGDDYTFELSNSTFEGKRSSWVSPIKQQVGGSFLVAYNETPTTSDQQRVFRITDCTFNTIGDFHFMSNNIGNGQTLSNIYIDNCKFNNGRIHGYNVTNFNITNSRFTNEAFNGYNGVSTYTLSTQYVTNISSSQISCVNCDRVLIKDNYLEGSELFTQHLDYGIQCQVKYGFRKTSAGANTKIWYSSNIKIVGNTVARYSFGIGNIQRYDDPFSGWNSYQNDWGNGTHLGCEINNNIVLFHKDAQYGPTYRPIWGIMAMPGVDVKNNKVYYPLNTPANVIEGIMVWGINPSEKVHLLGSVVENNTVWSPNSVRNMIIGYGSSGVLEDNVILRNNVTVGTIYAPNSFQQNNTQFSTAFPHLINPYMNPDLSGFLQNISQY